MPTSSQYYAHVAGPLMGFWSRLNHFSNPQAEEFSWGAHKSRMSPAWVSYLQSDYQLMPSALNAYWLGCCTLVQWFLERQRGDKVVGQKNLKAPSVSTFCHATVPSWSYTRIRGIAHADYLYVQTIYSSRFVIPDSTFLTRTYGLTFCIRNLPVQNVWCVRKKGEEKSEPANLYFFSFPFPPPSGRRRIRKKIHPTSRTGQIFLKWQCWLRILVFSPAVSPTAARAAWCRR